MSSATIVVALEFVSRLCLRNIWELWGHFNQGSLTTMNVNYAGRA
jgi:hypothetical protein